MLSSLGSAAGGSLPMFQEEPACAKMCPNISFKHRIIGFGACFATGWFLSFMGTLTLLGGPSAKNIRTFIILYIFGNVIALCSTGFLLGPRSQCRQMFHPTRRYSTIFYLVMLIIVFAVAVAKQNVGIVLFLLFIQVLAGLWYSISYIPFARKFILGMARRGPCKPCFELSDQMKESMGQANGSNKSGGMMGMGKSDNSGGGFMSKRGFTLLNDD